MKNRSKALILLLMLLLCSCSDQSPLPPLGRAEAWLDQLPLDLQAIAEKGYGDKKRLSEILGAYWKLYRYSSAEHQTTIRQRLQPFVDYTRQSSYLDWNGVSDKQFKKNSMSYFRVMWLLREMDFNIDHLLKGYELISKRMDAHLKKRGPWQRGMFSRYYDFFNLEKPEAIANTDRMTGPIRRRLQVSKYDVTRAYQLTHQVFVAFDYGAKRLQTRFNDKELRYLDTILPPVTLTYQKKKNWDLLAELLTCMVYLKISDKPEFDNALKALLAAQNENGSWGSYERLRNKYGQYTDAKYYLHTTGVVIEALVEHTKGDW